MLADFQMRQNPVTSWSVVITSDSLSSLTVEVLLTPASWWFSSFWKFSACALRVLWQYKLENIFFYLSFKWWTCCVAVILKKGHLLFFIPEHQEINAHFIVAVMCTSINRKNMHIYPMVQKVLLNMGFNWPMYFEVVTIHSDDCYRSPQMNASEFFYSTIWSCVLLQVRFCIENYFINALQSF